MTSSRRRQKRTTRNANKVAPAEKSLPGGWRLPGWLAGTVTILSVIAVVFVLTYRPVTDPDTWFHLELGEWIAANGELPVTDPFSYTAGDTPYTPSGWLTALLMHHLDRIYPESSLWPILMVTAVILVASIIILWLAKRRRTMIITSLLLMAGLLAAAIRFSPRPDVWSILGLTAMLALITSTFNEDQPTAENPRTQWRLWLLIPLVIIWANLHAGVLVCIPFLGVYAAWLIYSWIKTRNNAHLHVVIPVIIACFVWTVNPYGVKLAGLAKRIADMPKAEWVMEWMPFFKPDFPHAWPVYVGALIIIAALILVVFRRPKQFHPIELVWLAFLVGLALIQRRQVSLVAVGIPLILSRHLLPAEAWLKQRPFVALGLPVLMAASVAGLQITGKNGTGGGMPTYGRNCTVLPCYASEFLIAYPPPEPIFNSYNLGGYLLNALYPETKVYIDGRLDVYPEQVWLDMLAVEESRLTIDELIARYGIQTFVITISDSFGDPAHLASRLAGRPDFSLVHLDDLTAIFVRRTIDTAQYLESHAYNTLHPWNLDQMASAATNRDQVQAITDEMGRMLMQAGPSAATASLAAFIAFAVGDSITMNEQLAAASSVRPDYPLLQQVTARIAAMQLKRR